MSSPAEFTWALVARASSHTQTETDGQLKELLFCQEQTKRCTWAQGYTSQQRTEVKTTSNTSSSLESCERLRWQLQKALQFITGLSVKILSAAGPNYLLNQNYSAEACSYYFQKRYPSTFHLYKQLLVVQVVFLFGRREDREGLQ